MGKLNLMSRLIKVLLLIPHLGGGGAERVTAQLARSLDPQRFDIHLALITHDAPGAEPLPPWVTMHRLNAFRVRQGWPQLLRLIRKQRPDILLSGMAHLNFAVLLMKPFLPRETRLLVRQNTTASASSPSRLTRQFYRRLYPRADAILCQSLAMAQDLATHFGIPMDSMAVLANPVDVESIRNSAFSSAHNSVRSSGSLRPMSPWRSTSTPRLLAVGRLAREKGFDLLLQSLAELRPSHPNIHLAILGAGWEEASLKHLCRKLDLQQSVTFTGHADPCIYYPQASLFILPSRHEGMPNALLEAAAAGLPIVATPCSPGLTQLLDHVPGTWITPAITSESLTQTIVNSLNSLITEPARYPHGFLEPFRQATAIAAYESLLTTIAMGVTR